MKTKKLALFEGGKFKTLKAFHKEMYTVFTFNLSCKIEHNLDAFNDLLRGGFGVFEYQEEIVIFWSDFAKSELLLGVKTTNSIVEFIKKHQHIELILN